MLRALFLSIGLHDEDGDDVDSETGEGLSRFADDLFEKLFMPCNF